MLDNCMHEIGIAQDLSAIIIETAENENLSKVTKVYVTLGKLVQIVPEIFEFAFREAVRDSIAEDAELSIELVPVIIKCRSCGNHFQAEDNMFYCNLCSSTDVDVIQGKELFIKSIEGE